MCLKTYCLPCNSEFVTNLVICPRIVCIISRSTTYNRCSIKVGTHCIRIILQRKVSKIRAGFSTYNIYNLCLSGSKRSWVTSCDHHFGPFWHQKKEFEIKLDLSLKYPFAFYCSPYIEGLCPKTQHTKMAVFFSSDKI